MYKIEAPLTLKMPKWSMCLHCKNLDYGFEAYATQAFNAPDGRVLAVSWLGFQMFLPIRPFWTTKGPFSLVKELTIKDGNSTSTLSQQSKNLRSEEVFPNRTKPITPNELELHRPIAKARLSCSLIKKARAFNQLWILSMDRWQWIVVRLVNSTPKTLVRAVVALSITKLQTAIIFSSTSRFLKFSSIKEKSIFWSCLPTCGPKWILIKSETQLELTMN